jgi:hypothetical protein
MHVQTLPGRAFRTKGLPIRDPENFFGQLIYSLFFIFSNTVIAGKNPNFLKKSDAFSLPVLTKNPVSHRAAFIRS